MASWAVHTGDAAEGVRTLAAAAKNGRRAFGCELNPVYVGLIGKRMGNVVRDMFASAVG